MFLPLLLTAGLAAAQTAPVEVTTSRLNQGRFFVSPMGEPFYGRKPGEDGLVVWFEQADRNHDGFVTAEEMSADADRFFSVLDRQHDGEIDPDDMNYYEAVVAPQLRAQSIVTRTDLPGGETKEQVDDETASGKFGLLAIPQPVASADRNFDRGVSPDEFRAAARRRFQLLDTTSVGRLTLAQLQNLRQAASDKARYAVTKNPSPADNPTSAEYGGSSIPQ
jgi:hypothetical protein